MPTKLEKALEQFYLINSRKLYMILQVFACCWPFLRSKPWIHCCWAQTNRMILCNQYFTPWRGNQMVINYLLNIAMTVHFENTSVTVRIWVYDVEEREWTFHGFGHRVRILNWKAPLEFNSAPYFHKRRNRSPRKLTYFFKN